MRLNDDDGASPKGPFESTSAVTQEFYHSAHAHGLEWLHRLRPLR